MHQYSCPKCKTILKRDEPIPAGKKIKCPKCETIFAPPAVAVKAGKPVEARSDQAKARDKLNEEDDLNPYGVQQESEVEAEASKAERARAAAGVVKDRFKKSKRGPAQGKVTAPAGWMTAAGVIMGIFWVIVFVVGLFPLVFRSYYTDAPEFKGLSPAAFQEKWEQVVLIRVILMVGACVGFIYASFVTIGAFKMRTLESYGWAMTGAILTTMMPGIWFVIGIWALMTLRDKAVIEGFAEEKPPEII